MTLCQYLREETSINLTNISELVYYVALQGKLMNILGDNNREISTSKLNIMKFQVPVFVFAVIVIMSFRGHLVFIATSSRFVNAVLKLLQDVPYKQTGKTCAHRNPCFHLLVFLPCKTKITAMMAVYVQLCTT